MQTAFSVKYLAPSVLKRRRSRWNAGMDRFCAARREVKRPTRGHQGSRCPSVPRPQLRARGLRVRRGGKMGGEPRAGRAHAWPQGPRGPGTARPSPVRRGTSRPVTPPALALAPSPSPRAGRRAPASPAEPGWAAREASPPQPPPPRAGAEALRPLPGSTPGTAAPGPPTLPPGPGSPAAAEDTSWKINKLIPPLTPAAGRGAGGGRGIRSSPS